LTIFGTNIPDTTGHQMALEVPTSPNTCFYTTWETRTLLQVRYYILYKAVLSLY